MPILYEDMDLQPKKKRMYAQVTDSQEVLVVALSSGNMQIDTSNTYCFDSNFNKITKAAAGQQIGFMVRVVNAGSADAAWIEGVDKDTGAVLVRTDGVKFQATTSSLGAGNAWTFQTNWYTMPNKQFNVLITAGHGS